MPRTLYGFIAGAVAGVASTLALVPWGAATAAPPAIVAEQEAPPVAPAEDSPAAGTPLQASKQAPDAALAIDLHTNGKREARFDASCGEAFVEIIDAKSSNPRFILAGTCNGVRFDVVAYTSKLPSTFTPHRVRMMDTATGEERIATSASVEVTQFGDVGDIVAGRLEFEMPQGLNKGSKKIGGTFRVKRAADRSSP